jgi:hypothetical protein
MKENNYLLKKFRKNWKAIAILEDKQLRKLSIKQRLYQLASVLNIGRGLKLGFGEDQQKLNTRSRWLLLKKGRQR